MLRPYQQRTIDQLYEWFGKNDAGNPCLSLPTGAGKSHIVAALCKDALQSWPETRILMLTHVKELIEQNAEKLRQHWPGAPMGIYSASVGRKQLDEPITFAGIQSVRNRAAQIGHVDIVIIDECHLVSHKDEGGYRTLLNALAAINPALRIVGLTATPYRLGHGLITDAPALFHDLIEPVTIEELIYKGHLAPLRSKLTKTVLDTSQVHKRGGEYIESELQAAVDTDHNNEQAVQEVINLAGNRKAWLFFCAGVDHAQHIAAVLTAHGIPADCVTGGTSKSERQRILTAFKAGELRAVTNANVLTTGFDYPDIDLIAMLRPTMSASLYVQMAGRGMRPSVDKQDCLVLDFAGVVQQHGPITAVQPPRRKGEGNGEAPMKVCDACDELCHISAKVCPACGAPFPEREAARFTLHNDDIMGLENDELEVKSWHWRDHTSRSSGKEMLAVTYYGDLSDAPVTEYLTVTHSGYAGENAINLLTTMARSAGVQLDPDSDLAATALALNEGAPPTALEYRRDGKFHRVLRRNWA